jgi:hypothetical protein
MFVVSDTQLELEYVRFRITLATTSFVHHIWRMDFHDEFTITKIYVEGEPPASPTTIPGPPFLH